MQSRPPAERQASDAELARRVTAGETDLFALLVERHGPRVRRLVARNVPCDVADEVAHDAMVTAYLSLASWRPTHPLERWLTRIALRACVDHWRARGTPRPSVDADLTAIEHPQGDDRELLEWALAHLEPEDRQVLALVYFEQLDTRECAEVLGWSRSKVKVRAHRARARLREILQRALPELGE